MDKIEELVKLRNDTEEEIEKSKTSVTILFSDIRGSTFFFSMEGDVEGIAMIQRHNRILFPIIQKNRGRVVKTIGDAIMAVFKKPEQGLLAAIGMQKALRSDNVHRAPNQEIHIRIGMHSGLGLEKENDVYGDVVNTASRVEHQSQPDTIFVSESMVAAAKTLGLGLTEIGPVEIKGKIDTITLYQADWDAFDLAKARIGSDIPLKHWILAAAGGCLLAVGAWMALSTKQSMPAAAQQSVNSTIAAPAPKTIPSSADSVSSTITRDNVVQTLMGHPTVVKMFEKAGKPMTRDLLLSETFRAFQGSPAETAGETVKRGEFAMVVEDLMIVASGKSELATTFLGAERSPFDDVNVGQPIFNAVMTTTQNGLIDVADHFRPNDPVDHAFVQSALNGLDKWLAAHGGIQ